MEHESKRGRQKAGEELKTNGHNKGGKGMIQLLDDATVNQIAAGEVIERPSAVVKELVENALDAGANAITVEIKDGGIAMVRVTDNGCGIPKEELPAAFERHATSKIRRVEDLFGVTSLGFRGEALSSIAAVSQVELVTRVCGELVGARYLIEGGAEKQMEEIGCPEGTTFISRNLFYNTPARRKFLKSASTEAGYVNDLMERLAISHPAASITFITNRQVRLHTSGNGNVKDMIYHIYGRDIAGQVVAVEYGQGELCLEGYIGKPIVSRGNRNYMNYFINGRYIKSTLVNQAIEEAYKPFSMKHKYPFTVLFLTIPGEQLDVNVHPAKLEVRFQNQEEVYEAVRKAVGEALSREELIPKVGWTSERDKAAMEDMAGKTTTHENITARTPEPFEAERRKESGMGGRMADLTDGGAAPNQVRDPSFYAEKAPSSVFTGQMYLKHGRASLELMSQEAPLREESEKEQAELVSEKKNKPANPDSGEPLGEFQKEEFTGKEPGKGAFQKEEVHKEEVHHIEAFQKKEALGQQMELFEDKLLSKQAVKEHQIIGQIFDTYWIVQYREQVFFIDQHAAHEKVLYERTMAALKNKEPMSQMLEPPVILTLSLREKAVLMEYQGAFEKLGFVLEEFGEDAYAVRAVPANLTDLAQTDLLMEMIDALSAGERKQTPELLMDHVATMSCKAAVKGGRRLSVEEAKALIGELMTLENPYHCPHGRPTIISMTKYEIEKKFRRVL